MNLYQNFQSHSEKKIVSVVLRKLLLIQSMFQPHSRVIFIADRMRIPILFEC